METILSFYDSSHIFSNWVFILTGIILSYIGHLMFKKLLGVIVTKIVIRSKNNWDDILIEAGVLERFSLLVPIVIIYSFLPKCCFRDKVCTIKNIMVRPKIPNTLKVTQKSVD